MKAVETLCLYTSKGAQHRIEIPQSGSVSGYPVELGGVRYLLTARVSTHGLERETRYYWLQRCTETGGLEEVPKLRETPRFLETNGLPNEVCFDVRRVRRSRAA